MPATGSSRSTTTPNPAATVVVDTTASPHAAHRPVPVANVRFADDLLAPRLRTNLRETLPSQYRLLEETGRLRNFARAAGKVDGVFAGRYYNDSDVYKWLEAASWALVSDGSVGDEDTSELRGMIDAVVDLIAGAQRKDGYLHTYYARELADERWTNLQDKHELYCAGHLFQAAVAHHRATGSDTLLSVATRFADHICDVFGPAAEGKQEQTDGHPEIELALIELFRETGEQRYIDQARFFIDVRGKGTIGGQDYHQDATPLRKQRAMVGHAVRAVYLNAGAADLVAETGDAELRQALEAMLANLLRARSYVTGGVGARWEGEAFGADFELPNERAYAETCAAIGNVMWMWRMLLLEAADDTRFPDIIERTLYNAILPGVSLDGQLYFYQNPLADGGNHRRQPWFGTACCPPNIARLLAQLPGYVATVTSRRFPESDARHDFVWIHLFAEGELTVPLQSGGSVTLRMTTRYPWDGDVAIAVTNIHEAGDFTLQIRVPEWAKGTHGTVNGERLPDAETAPGQYVTIRRTWQVGDEVRLAIPLPIRRLVAHPRVTNNAGRVALMRGPLVYCAEAADNPIGDVLDVVIPDDATILAAQRPELLGGVVVLTASAELEAAAPGWDGALYRRLDRVEADQPGRSDVDLVMIPYMVWANRGAGPMAVWLRRG